MQYVICLQNVCVMYGKANSHTPHASSPAYIIHTYIHTHTHIHIHTHTHTHTQVHTYTYTSFAYATNSLPYITPLFRILCLSLTHTHTHTHNIFLSFTCTSHSLCSPHTHHIVSLSLTHTTHLRPYPTHLFFICHTLSLYNKHVCCRDREGVWFMRQRVCVCGVRGIYIHHALTIQQARLLSR